MTAVIGTAGWAIPAADRSSFPATGSSLERYASVLAGVEINSSFHRPHRRSTWERWSRSVPDGFGFAAKIPKEVSHVRRLVGAEAAVERFLDEVSGLGEKLAILLLQLPPSFVFDQALLRAFLTSLTSRTAVPVVCEPRHESWFSVEADALLAELRVARVAADPAKVPQAALAGGWRGLTYMRLHGSPVMYRSPYGANRLRSYAALIEADLSDGRPVWCMFDNTASWAALGDALQLARLLGPVASSPRDNSGAQAHHANEQPDGSIVSDPA